MWHFYALFHHPLSVVTDGGPHAKEEPLGRHRQLEADTLCRNSPLGAQ